MLIFNTKYLRNPLILSTFTDNYNILIGMKESEKDIEIEALKAALKREREKNAKLKAKHEADKAEIKNLKRRKGPKEKGTSAKESAKSKKKLAAELKASGLSEEQSRLAQDILRAIGILKK